MVLPHKPSKKSIYNQPSGNTAQTKTNTSQEPPNKTTTLSSGTGVRGLLQMIEMQLVNLSGLDTKSLVFCDTACSNSWVAGSLADGLVRHVEALKLAVKGLNTKKVVDNMVVEMTVKKREPFQNHLPATHSLMSFCFLCSKDKYKLRQCLQPKKCRDKKRNNLHNTLSAEQIWSVRINPHQNLFIIRNPATQLKPKPILVKSPPLRPQRSHLVLGLGGSFR